MRLFKKEPVQLHTVHLEFTTSHNGVYKVTHKGVTNFNLFQTVESGDHCVAVYHELEFANGEVQIYRETHERQLQHFKKEKN